MWAQSEATQEMAAALLQAASNVMKRHGQITGRGDRSCGLCVGTARNRYEIDATGSCDRA